MPQTFIKLKCPICGSEYDKYIGYYNKALKIGAPLYCGKKCAGIGRRDNKTIEQKKAEKAEYDKKYRADNIELLKRKKHEYHERTYDPAKAAILRKSRMSYHVEYCRRPEYKKYKKQYDEKHRAKKEFGEFYEAALAIKSIDAITDSRETFREKKKYLKSTSTKKRQNGKRNIKRNQP